MNPIKFAIAFFVFAIAAYTQAAPLLNGLSLERQFNKDRYIAAVYSDTLASSASTLLDNNTNRRLEVRIVAGDLSARRFRNRWMESIAINNSGNLLSQQAHNMVTFANLFKGRFHRGDRLTVDFAAVTGTSSIAINGVALGEIPDRNFFNTLLRAWIGPVPPSSDFRDGLLAAGDVSASLRNTYEQLKPSAERIAALTEQLAQAAQPGEEAEEEPQTATAKPAPDKPTSNKPELAAKIPAPTLAAAASKPVAATVATVAAKPKPSRSKPAARPTPPPREVEVAVEEEEEAPLTADLILARQIYHSQLLRHTFKNLRYPERAQKRGQEGSVRLSVTIDAQGRVTGIRTMQDSRYASLNREALDAVERASPYPAAPPQLIRGEYEFSIPITFRLAD